MSILTILIAAIGGAGLMFLLDPERGRRRRALVRDQVVKLANRTRDDLSGLTEEAKNRAIGAVAETRSRFQHNDVPDDTLVARVRSMMGRYVSHPGAIHVTANQGNVMLSGSILATEVQPFVRALNSMPGVRSVDNQLHMYESAEHIPEVQGGVRRTELR